MIGAMLKRHLDENVSYTPRRCRLLFPPFFLEGWCASHPTNRETEKRYLHHPLTEASAQPYGTHIFVSLSTDTVSVPFFGLAQQMNTEKIHNQAVSNGNRYVNARNAHAHVPMLLN